ncbi:MAG: alanine racemase [Azovibrio sp.]|uniref:alanine racemase n=1 Tax=Azovibrio sp. TaxID=1872673 RepID=UPI003C75DF7A
MNSSTPGVLPGQGRESCRPVSRPIRARIDLNALRHNFAVARHHAGPARIWAVIKANAYGHGQWQVARALADLADGFALLEVESAIALRQAGFSQPLLLLEGFFAPEDVALLARHDLTPVVHSPAQLLMLEAAANRPGQVYVKLNTSMNRLGFCPGQLPEVLERLQRLGIREVTLMSHFAEADGGRGIEAQFGCFSALAGDAGLPVSLANSAALLRYPETRGDWVRPGIMLYGSSPFADISASSLGLRPVMHLESRLIGIQTLAAGERVGYGGLFQAGQPMRIGIVACGYADGYPRHAPTGTPIAVAGQPSRVLGRVSMDMLACDLSGIDAARVGSPVTLWGIGEGGTVDVDQVAAAAGTLSYELFCALAPRVPVAWG